MEEVTVALGAVVCRSSLPVTVYVRETFVPLASVFAALNVSDNAEDEPAAMEPERVHEIVDEPEQLQFVPELEERVMPDGSDACTVTPVALAIVPEDGFETVMVSENVLPAVGAALPEAAIERFDEAITSY